MYTGLITTLPETNIAPKNGRLEFYFPFGKAYFQVRIVCFREGKGNIPKGPIPPFPSPPEDIVDPSKPKRSGFHLHRRCVDTRHGHSKGQWWASQPLNKAGYFLGAGGRGTLRFPLDFVFMRSFSNPQKVKSMNYHPTFVCFVVVSLKNFICILVLQQFVLEETTPT